MPLRDNGRTHEPVPMTLQLFKPNFIQYKTEAINCKIVKTTITSSGDLFMTAYSDVYKASPVLVIPDFSKPLYLTTDELSLPYTDRQHGLSVSTEDR